MSWYKYKDSQMVYGYHGTNIELVDEIKRDGLVAKAGEEVWFSDNEDDLSPYVDGLWLRFPLPSNYATRTGMGSYYTTSDRISPSRIEFKLNLYDSYKPLNKLNLH